MRFSRRVPVSDLVSLIICCDPSCEPSGRIMMPSSASWSSSVSRQCLRRGGDDDAIIRAPARHAGEPIADHDLDIVVAECLETIARLIGERAIALDAHHLARQAATAPRPDSRSPCRSPAHDGVGPHAELLGHIGHDIRLADGLAAGDRQCLVGIGAARKARSRRSARAAPRPSPAAPPGRQCPADARSAGTPYDHRPADCAVVFDTFRPLYRRY